ncbi:hypothetical protein BKA03_002892 [Demequina lutea]|uniref:Uncharacterized protein n=1 Tax=Demequina lutea TaxID=431489 RepID=A0A7Y9ZEJ4_9MICO|nr:hypothetical protein [Demequina lutea]
MTHAEEPSPTTVAVDRSGWPLSNGASVCRTRGNRSRRHGTGMFLVVTSQMDHPGPLAGRDAIDADALEASGRGTMKSLGQMAPGDSIALGYKWDTRT